MRQGYPSCIFAVPWRFCATNPAALGGAVLAARTSLLGVTCRSLIDATDHGLCARLAGLKIVPRRDVPAMVSWTVLAKEAPSSWPGEIEEIRPSFSQAKGGDIETWPAFRLWIDRSRLGSDPIATEHVARSLLVDNNLRITADFLADRCPESLPAEGETAESLDALDETCLQPEPDLWMLNDLLPVSWSALELANQSGAMFDLARRIGKSAALSVSASRKPGRVALWEQSGVSGDFHFAEALLREVGQTFTTGKWTAPDLGKFDVVVVGGGTCGAPAGIGAARQGARTLVLEAQHGLGGVGTLGLISSYWFGNKVGFTAELNEALMEIDSVSRQKKGNVWSPEAKSAIYHRLLQDAGGRAWNGSHAFGVRMEGRVVTGVLVTTPFGSGLVEAGCVIDATGNADIAAAAGAPCRVITGSHVAVQGTGLSPRLHPDIRHQNSDHTFVDDTDPFGVSFAHVHARAKYPEAFDLSSLVDTRERRQIIGEIELSPLDLLAGRTFDDTLFTACSNFDTHGFTVHPVFMVAPPDHAPLGAHVPFRCMLPKGIENVVVAGLGMSAHRDALPVIRMQADVQNQGFAAGIAAARAAEQEISIRHIDLQKLQATLAEIGILAPEVPRHTDSFPLSPEVINEAARGDLGVLTNVAILFAHPGQSVPALLEILRDDSDAKRRSDAALILGLMGISDAAPILADMVRAREWDEGWNYRGMGQFGASMSRLDAEIIALSKTGDPAGRKIVEEKILALDENAAFSHCRAVALAAAELPSPEIAAALVQLLEKPGVQGHAWTRMEVARDQANDNMVETLPRNLALRELHLARGLYRVDPENPLGRKILEQYARDLRGPFARHAKAVLRGGDSNGQTQQATGSPTLFKLD